MKHAFAALLLWLLSVPTLFAQQEETITHNTIGWYNYFGTFRITPKIGIHTEYQWRRSQLVTHPQQSLLRTGINYNLKPSLKLRIGYAWIETSAYGEIPVNALGRDFTEHRTFQMVQATHRSGKGEFLHRAMLEQRFTGRYSSPEIETEDAFSFSNRLRYMFRFQLPLKGERITSHTPYLATFTELFASFGRNVSKDGIDQLRTSLLAGYQFSSTARLEAGYLFQGFQYSRQINGNDALQVNHGVIINCVFNVDLSSGAIE
ncbi:MAG: DUF2490 domain-containing protein [Flavobacteriales bacterium]